MDGLGLIARGRFACGMPAPSLLHGLADRFFLRVDAPFRHREARNLIFRTVQPASLRGSETYPILYNPEVPSLRPVHWIGDSQARLRAAQAEIRSDAGYQLDLVQRGQAPADFKPMPDVGSGVMEIRLHGESEYRVFYVARFEEAVYVLHFFVKKTRTTRKADIDLGKQRYSALLESRKGRT